LLAVKLDEGELTLLGVELEFMIDILRKDGKSFNLKFRFGCMHELLILFCAKFNLLATFWECICCGWEKQ
jgi:hypothetical protein